MTKGTIAVLVANLILAVVGVLQGFDWVHVVGSSTAGWIVVVLAALNAGAHAITGSDGLLSTKAADGPPPNATVK